MYKILKGENLVNRKFKKVASVFVATTMSLSLLTGVPFSSPVSDTTSIMASAVTTQCDTYSGSNAETQNYSRWASTIKSHLVTTADGKLMRVQADAVDGYYLVEYYDTEYNIQSTVKVAQELSIFGGFYETDSNYYILSGQTNTDEDESVECYRITKYDKNWNKISSTGLSDCNTTVPFDAGSARFAECGKYLLIRTCHEMYTSSDGYNHQANVTIQLDTEAMEITDSYTVVMNSSYGYVSHSFNQFIQIEDNKIVAIDHGDAYPRSIALLKYQTDVTGGTFKPSYYKQCDVVNLLEFPGNTGENVTGASVGGFEISNTSYLTAYNSVIQDESNLTRSTRNIYVSSYNKTTSENTIKQITNFAEGEASASTPQLVKLSDSEFILLWSRSGNVYYAKLDSDGDIVGDIQTMSDAQLSDCVPVVSNNKLIWYVWNNEVNTFYDIDLTDISNTSKTVIENGHVFDYTYPTSGGSECTRDCKNCEYSDTVTVPTSMNLYWKTTETGGYSSTCGDIYKDTKLKFWNYNSGSSYNDLVITVSDPDSVQCTMDSKTIGTLTFSKEGKYTVTFAYKYNPEVSQTYTFYVQHDADHSFDFVPPSDGSNVCTRQCKDCDYTDEITVLTSFSVWWNENNGSGYYYSNFTKQKHPGDTLAIWVSPLESNVDNSEMEVTVSDPDAIDCDYNTSNNMGTLTFNKVGEYTITVAPKYNPSVAKTYTVSVSHTDENADGICDTCDGFIDGVGANLSGYSLSLSGNIGVNYYMELDESVASSETAYMEFKLPDGTTSQVSVKDATTATVNEKTYYVFSCEVSARQITDTITAQMVVDENTKGTAYTYSVKEYADYLIANTDSNEEYAKAEALVKSMLNYGGYSQTYFDYNTENMANADVDSTLGEVTISDDYATQIAGELPEGVTYYGSSLLLKSNTVIRHYFKIADGAEIPSTSWGELKQKGNFYYVDMTGISAQELDTMQTLTIEDWSIEYSALSYAKAVLESNTTNDNLKNVTKALYFYNKSADEYFT